MWYEGSIWKLPLPIAKSDGGEHGGYQESAR
jgi:hypothetical protein